MPKHKEQEEKTARELEKLAKERLKQQIQLLFAKFGTLHFPCVISVPYLDGTDEFPAQVQVTQVIKKGPFVCKWTAESRPTVQLSWQCASWDLLWRAITEGMCS